MGLSAGLSALAGDIFACSLLPTWPLRQELTSILGFLPAQQAKATGEDADDPDDGDENIEQSPAGRPKRKLQTFVFSATLTLPEGLRKRLKRGVLSAVLPYIHFNRLG